MRGPTYTRLAAVDPLVNGSTWAVGVPVGEELLKADIGQRMLNHLLIDAIRHRANVSPCQRRFNDVHRVPDARNQDFGFEIVVVVDGNDLPNKLHPIGADVIKAANKW